jgi:hypothetical protein
MVTVIIPEGRSAARREKARLRSRAGAPSAGREASTEGKAALACGGNFSRDFAGRFALHTI